MMPSWFIVDRLSKSVRFCPTTSDVDAAGSAKLFFNHWYRHYGFPRKIVSDRDELFVGKVWQELFRLTAHVDSFTKPQVFYIVVVRGFRRLPRKSTEPHTLRSGFASPALTARPRRW
jgi:hypothetical protein